LCTSPQLASFEAAFTLSSTRGVLLGRKENVLILWLARCKACVCTSPQLASFEAAFMCTSPQLASFEAAFTPSSTRGVLLSRKQNVLILWLARCEACMRTSPQLASFDATFALSSTWHAGRFIRLQRKCSYSAVGLM
jgi:hypothetical protein